MSPPRGGDSWKWSETENQSKPLASANFHSLRISARGPPMWPRWIPNFMSRSCEIRERSIRELRALERGEIGGRAADLRVAEQRGIDLPHVSGQAAGPAEVQRVDQDRRVRALGLGDDAGGMGEGPHARVDRELQADVQVVLGRAIAELAKPLDRPRLVRLGAHHE